MFSEKLKKILKGREFLNIATADSNGQPNAVPKFLLKVEPPYIYLVDYTMGQSIHNLRLNPRVSLCLMDLHDLEGYRMNGSVQIIDEGEHHGQLARELERRAIQLTATRVIEGSRTGKKYEHYEIEIPDRFVVLKVHIEEVVKIGARGDLFHD